MLQALRLLLWPFSLLYSLLMTVRNRLFDAGWLPATAFPLPVISVGNLTVGGTGKTPLTELLLQLLSGSYRCATLSRGYGRATKGLRLAKEEDTALSIGDEPRQLQLKFPRLQVAVAEKRVEGMQALLRLPHPPQVVVLDDAFQHRYVKAGLSILVVDYHRPLWKDFCLPAGNLRESFAGRKRADLVVVNKCPPKLSEQEAEEIRKKLSLTPKQTLFFASMRYLSPRPLGDQATEALLEDRLPPPGEELIVLAGIARPEPFFRQMEAYGRPLRKLVFPDHHAFSAKDVEQLRKALKSDNTGRSIIVTTEKDAVRLAAVPEMDSDLLSRIWYQPIRLQILFDQQKTFENLILSYVEQNQGNG